MLHAAPRREDIPTITPDDLKECDGYIFVIATRYGRAVGQFSSFFDATGSLWMAQSLSGKFATVMTSTGTQSGGQETTALTTLPFFAHHGISYVPFGYVDPAMTTMDEIKGGAPWGAGTLAGGDGSRQPSALEIAQVGAHAKHFTEVVTQFIRGGERLAIEKTKDAGTPKALKEAKRGTTMSQSSGSGSSAAGSEGKKKKGVKGKLDTFVKGVKSAFSSSSSKH